MGTAPPNPAIPHPAASLLLLRDGAAGLEVLMVQRIDTASFAPGMPVFPGGRVDPEDRHLRPYCAAGGDLDDTALALRVAAIRETFEECGLLLARPAPDASTPRWPTSALAAGLRGEAPPLVAAIEKDRAMLSTDLLVPYAHWITPTFLPKRFDTYFFAALAPNAETTAADMREIVKITWVSPAALVQQAEAGEINLMFATYMNLRRLSRARSAAEALEEARRGTVVTVLPEVVKTPEGRAFRVPEAAGYGETLVLERRFRRT